jgi:hypothetical protein
MNYSTKNYIIPSLTVGKNCSEYLNNTFSKILKKYHRQTYRTNDEIWGQLLKYNKHEFTVKCK